MEEKGLADHLSNRVMELKEAKSNGIKIIGYFPGNYVPEELIYASGAVPICLAYGGNSNVTDAAFSVTPSSPPIEVKLLKAVKLLRASLLEIRRLSPMTATLSNPDKLVRAGFMKIRRFSS